VVRELSILAPVLGTPHHKQRLFVIPSNTSDMPIEVIAKVHDGETYIIAVNRSDKKITAQIEGISWDVGSTLNVCFEERQIDVNQERGAFIDKFGPYAVHVYSTKMVKNDLRSISENDLKYLNIVR
jgi:hypothetical protein